MGISFVRPDGTFPGRVIAGLQMLRQLDMAWVSGWNDVRWGVLRAVDGEFVVSDALLNPAPMPVLPTVYLSANVQDRLLDYTQVAHLNHVALRASLRYSFARDFERCPMPNAVVRALNQSR